MTAKYLPSETARLSFRAWRDDDLPLAQALWGNPAVTRFISRAPYTPDEVRARLDKELASDRLHGFQYWPIFLEEGAALAGCCGLRPPVFAQPANSERLPELGFHLVPECWDRGLATEAARAVIALAFGVMGAGALFAGHHPENLGSKRVLEKLGFRLLGTALYPPTGLQHPNYCLEASHRRS